MPTLCQTVDIFNANMYIQGITLVINYSPDESCMRLDREIGSTYIQTRCHSWYGCKRRPITVNFMEIIMHILNMKEIVSVSLQPASAECQPRLVFFCFVRATWRAQRGHPEPARVVHRLGLQARVQQLLAQDLKRMELSDQCSISFNYQSCLFVRCEDSIVVGLCYGQQLLPASPPPRPLRPVID